MAKRPDGYFAFKLIAPSIAKHSTLLATSTITEPWGSASAPAPKSAKMRAPEPPGFMVADDDSHILHGDAGHLVGTVLNFTASEVAKCKSLFEAEQLVKSRYKAWLADAYDWFIFPGYLKNPPLTKKSSAAQEVVNKKVPATRQTSNPRGKK